jgi:hypothetical protein
MAAVVVAVAAGTAVPTADAGLPGAPCTRALPPPLLLLLGGWLWGGVILAATLGQQQEEE